MIAFLSLENFALDSPIVDHSIGRLPTQIVLFAVNEGHRNLVLQLRQKRLQGNYSVLKTVRHEDAIYA